MPNLQHHHYWLWDQHTWNKPYCPSRKPLQWILEHCLSLEVQLRRRDINKMSAKNEQSPKSIRDNHKGLPVAVHYNQTDHSIHDLSCVILNVNFTSTADRPLLKHIGRVVRMSVSGYRGWRFEHRHQYVVSFCKALYPHCFSRLSCEMSTRWGQLIEGCSVLWAFWCNST